jgi:uncharacterized phage-associated protein
MSDESPIRQAESHRADTFGGGLGHGRGTAVPTATALPRSPDDLRDVISVRRYVAPMAISAASVIKAIDARRPGLKPAKKHLLLFFAQGHHLAWAGEPLFDEPLYATDLGVRIAVDGEAVVAPSEAQLGTVTTVVVRYSSLSPAELRTLVQASTPWQLARKAGDDALVEPATLADWFRRADETDDPDDERPNRAERAEAEAYLASRGRS